MTSPSNLKNINILVVEDNALNAEFLVQILDSLNYCWKVASNGTEALDLLSSSSTNYFQLILSDIAMPGMNGYVLAKRIRSHPRADLSNLPIIAVTGEPETSISSNYRNYGMDDYLLKPLDIDILSTCINRWLTHNKIFL